VIVNKKMGNVSQSGLHCQECENGKGKLTCFDKLTKIVSIRKCNGRRRIGMEKAAVVDCV